MPEEEDEDRFKKENALPFKRSLKKVRTETMKTPSKKKNTLTGVGQGFDDGTSDGSYMVRIPATGAQPGEGYDMQS